MTIPELDTLRRNLEASGFLIQCEDLVGSEFIVGHGADTDICIFVTDTMHNEVPLFDILGPLVESGFLVTSGLDYPDTEDWLMTARLGRINLLICKTNEKWAQFVCAAETCRAVFLATGACDKRLRIAIHRTIMDDEPAAMALGEADAALAMTGLLALI